VIAAVPLTEPEVAEIVAVPLPADVTRPLSITVATEALEVDQSIGAPRILRPFWSSTFAIRNANSSGAEKERVVGTTATDVAILGSIPSPQPEAARHSVAPRANLWRLAKCRQLIVHSLPV